MNSHDSMNKILLRRIRLTILFYMAVLLASGITAFPLPWELSILVRCFGEGTVVGDLIPGLAGWLALVKEGLDSNAQHYPFIACGTDWLAFAHIMIAIAFVGPLRDPVKNIWIIHWGMLCCIGIIPLSLIGGSIRGIPWGWQCVDCSFGVFGIVPLLLIDRWTKRLRLFSEQVELYKVQGPSTAFIKEAELDDDGREIRYEYKDGNERIVAGLRFRDVSAMRRTPERSCRLWQIEGVYDTLVEVINSPWANEIKSAVPDHLVDDYQFHHYMIYLDSAGCFEFVASSWEAFQDHVSESE